MKKLLLLVMVALLCGVSIAGTRISEYVSEDFESYVASPASLRATGLPYGPPTYAWDYNAPKWCFMQELLEWWGIVAIRSDVSLDMKLAYSDNPNDPNGFMAEGELTDAHSLRVSYDFTAAPASGSYLIEPFMWAASFGLPTFEVVQGSGLSVPMVDLTMFDKVTVKFKVDAGNVSEKNDFNMCLYGMDVDPLHSKQAIGAQSGNGRFLTEGEGMWRALEWDLTGVTGLDKVIGISFGLGDKLGLSQGTFYIDDITFTIEDDPADITMDGAKDLQDLAVLAANWLQ